MFVYVINRHGKPLMPCRPARARKLLRDGKAKVIKRTPFTIKWVFQETLGYLTKFQRETVLTLPKTHYHDAVAIGCEEGEWVKPLETVFFKKYMSKGDYRQTCGKRSEKKIPTGKLFGLRKYDLIKTPQGIGFIQGKRSSGQFALMDIFGAVISAAVNVKKDCTRMAARTPTLLDRRRAFLPAVNGGVSCAQFG